MAILCQYHSGKHKSLEVWFSQISLFAVAKNVVCKNSFVGGVIFFRLRVWHNKKRPTPREPDAGDSAAFSSISRSVTSSFFYSQAESTPGCCDRRECRNTPTCRYSVKSTRDRPQTVWQPPGLIVYERDNYETVNTTYRNSCKRL